MFKVDYEKKLKEIMSTEGNTFQQGDFVEVAMLCDTYGNELDGIGDIRAKALCKTAKIDFVFGSDDDGGYVYGIEGIDYCFNKYELKLVD